jgi:ATP-dependent Clp protease ATP-binding subunit ClpA
MARLVEKTIKKPLSDLLLFGDVKDGDRIVVDLQDDAIQVKHA